MSDNKIINSDPILKSKIIYIILTHYFNLITLCLILIIFAVAYFYFLGPKRREISEAQANYSTQKMNMKQDLSIVLSKIEKYKSDYGKIDEEDKEKMNNMLLSDGAGKLEKEKLFILFESLIRSQGLILKSVNLSEEQGENDRSKTTAKKSDKQVPGIGQINVDLEVVGVNYASFKNLLGKIENNLMIMDLADVGFSPDQGSASLKIVMYYFK